jgi:hypothetical protein
MPVHYNKSLTYILKDTVLYVCPPQEKTVIFLKYRDSNLENIVTAKSAKSRVSSAWIRIGLALWIRVRSRIKVKC